MRSSFLQVSVFVSLFFIFAAILPAQNAPSRFKIWFSKPAESWNEALPVGNGKLGAMIFGGIITERLQLNEESVWTGQPRWDANPEARKTLPIVRKLLFEGKYKEAEELAQKGIMGKIRRDALSSYQTLGDMNLFFPQLKNISNYRRELDIEEAIARIQFTANGTNYLREIFSSATAQALVIRITADKPGSVFFSVKLSRPGNKAEINAAGNTISISEHVGDGIGVKIFSVLKVRNENGSLSAAGEIELLPALPSAWKTGYVHGLMARGGFMVDIDWENGMLKHAKILSKLGQPLKVSFNGKRAEISQTEAGKIYIIRETPTELIISQ